MRCFKTPYLEGMTILAEVTLKKKIEGNRRLCKLCQKQEISDEFHYIMECQFFTENRTQLMSRNLTQRRNILKFKQIMCTS